MSDHIMNDTENQTWTPCKAPQAGDVLKWNEPLWAAPNKPRGKRDQIGEQEVIATLTSIDNDLLQLTVIAARRISADPADVTIKKDDPIRRKAKSLEQGQCQKRVV
jgi:hypothetical protein